MKKHSGYPSHVYSGIGESPDSWGMCCSEEMARRCAECNWDNRESKLLLSIWLCFITSLCAIFLAFGAAVIQLVIVWGFLEAFLEAFKLNGSIWFYLVSELILLASMIPFWKERLWDLGYKRFYHFDAYEWIYIPVSLVAYVATFVISFISKI